MAITLAATTMTPRGTPTPIPILDLVEKPDGVAFSVTGGGEDDGEGKDCERVRVGEDGEGKDSERVLVGEDVEREGVGEGEKSVEV